MDAGHDHRAALQQRQGRSDLRVLVAVANLHVGGAGQAFASVYKESQQRKQHLAGLFVGQRQQRGRKLGATRVNVAPFARLDGIGVVRDARALGFEARRQVCKRSGVDQLPQSARCGLSKATNEVHKAQTVRARAFHEHVVDVVVAAALLFVVFLPIPTNSDNLEAVFGQCDDVGQLDSGRFAVFVLVFEAWDVQIDQLLQQKHLADVIGGLNARHFVHRGLDLARIGGCGVGFNGDVDVFAGQRALFVLVGVHWDAVREPRALRNDAGTVVRDVNIVCQAQF